jgi:hypothetical protein
MYPATQERICESVNISTLKVASISYSNSDPGSMSLLPFVSSSLSVSRPRVCASALVVLRVAQAASGSRPFCRTVVRRRSACTEIKDGRSMKFASRRQRKEFLAMCMVSRHKQESEKQIRKADYILAEVGFFPDAGDPSSECPKPV